MNSFMRRRFLHYGQARKTYFDAEQTRLIMANNRKFEVVSPVDQYFNLYFDVTDDVKQGEYLTAARFPGTEESHRFIVEVEQSHHLWPQTFSDAIHSPQAFQRWHAVSGSEKIVMDNAKS